MHLCVGGLQMSNFRMYLQQEVRSRTGFQTVLQYYKQTKQYMQSYKQTKAVSVRKTLPDACTTV
jgi:hypothetical protein